MNSAENERKVSTNFMSLENEGMRNKRMIKSRGYQRTSIINDEPTFP
jgi:hypothetical protein